MSALRFVCVFTLVVSGCSKPGDINKVSQPYWEKAYFNSKWQSQSLSPEQWHYGVKVIDAPANTKAVTVGDGHWLNLEKCSFEITQDYLICWRPYANVSGTENESTDSATSVRGSPIAAFAISAHFDVARDKDPTTLEETNLIVENAGGAWQKRKFMRVDFSRNRLHEISRKDSEGANLENDILHLVDNGDLSNPNQKIFAPDYFDVTTRQAFKTDTSGSSGEYGPAFGGDTSALIATIRHSFRRVPPVDYEPLPVPDSVVLKDANGKEKLDANGIVQRAEVWSKFGVFRTNFSGRPAWNDKRGMVESIKNINATRFNIWKQTIKSDGTLIPIEQREPKPIVYYTNVQHPLSLIDTSKEAANQWNRAFKEMVFHAQPGRYASVSHVPDMVILNQNSCNVDNVKKILSESSEKIRQAVNKSSKVDLDQLASQLYQVGSNHALSFTEQIDSEAHALANLERICAALMNVSASTDKPFVYQREGDLRFNLIVLITKRAMTPWSGYGPMLADPETGEIVQSTAYVNLWYIDKRAASASEQIDLLTGRTTLSQLIMGPFNKAVHGVPESRKLDKQYAASLITPFTQMRRIESSLGLIDLSQRLSGLVSTKNTFQPSGPQSFERRLKLLQSDRLNQSDGFTSASNMIRVIQTFEENRAHRSSLKNGLADPTEFVDQLITGSAMRYEDLTPKQRFYQIRKEIYLAVVLHELGHNFGLVHNMSGSSDVLNYGPKFWSTQGKPSDLNVAHQQESDPIAKNTLKGCIEFQQGLRTNAADIADTFTTQDCLSQSEGMYSSIMDYHAHWNSDLNGLGQYDLDAIKFAYAKLVPVFSEDAFRAKPASLKQWLQFNDWRKLPTEVFKDAQSIQNRKYVRWDWSHNGMNSELPANEVPYAFCMESGGLSGPTCKAFDFGPDMRSQAMWLKTQYWQHYYLTHFARDRIWSSDVDMQNVVTHDLGIFKDFNDILKWYYFRKATQPQFSGSDVEKDYLIAVVAGLNHYGHVLGHPEPGWYTTVPGYSLKSYSSALRVKDQMVTQKSMVPFSSLDECTAENVAQQGESGVLNSHAGHKAIHVGLGDGRSLRPVMSNDYEDNYVTHVGSLSAKLYAGYYLATPSNWFPMVDQVVDPRFSIVSWHKLFPSEVNRLFYNLITENWQEIGPTIDTEGKIVHRDLVNSKTLQFEDLSDRNVLLPTKVSTMPYQFMTYAAAMLSEHSNTNASMLHSMKVEVQRSGSTLEALSQKNSSEVETFIDPSNGYTYRAAKVGSYPVAFQLLKALNERKAQMTLLETCSSDENTRKTNEACHCLETKATHPLFGVRVCCSPANPFCTKPFLQPVGKEGCTMASLSSRLKTAKVELQTGVGLLNDMLWLVDNVSQGQK